MTLNKLKKMTSEEGKYSAGINYHNKEIQGQAEEAFNTLSSLAPVLALNPAAATTFVNRAIQNESQIEPELLKTLSEIQRNVASTNVREGLLSRAARDGASISASAKNLDSMTRKPASNNEIFSSLKNSPARHISQPPNHTGGNPF